MKNIGIALMLFNGLAVAGCAGGNVIDEAVPQAAFGDAAAPVPPERPALEQQVAAPAQELDEDITADLEARAGDALFTGSGQASQTGTFPNINNEPRGSVPQMTDQQRNALLAEMKALSVAHSKGLVSPAEYRRRLLALQRLAATHSDDAIKTIER